MADTINKQDVTEYLDDAISHWRGVRDENKQRVEKGDWAAKEEHTLAVHFVDAFQEVRLTLLGEALPEENPDA